MKREVNMKKWIYFFPAAAYGVFIVWASALFGLRSLEILAWIYGVLFLISGFLLSRKIAAGGVIGMGQGIYLIYLGKNSKTGLEIPVGIFLAVFYLLSMYLVWRENKRTEKSFGKAEGNGKRDKNTPDRR